MDKGKLLGYWLLVLVASWSLCWKASTVTVKNSGMALRYK